MERNPKYTRPPFAQAAAAWAHFLGERGFPTELIWVFEENLCIERDETRPGGYRLGYQVAFTPPPPEAQVIAYDHFSEVDAPLVWYRLGTAGGRSVCALLCDSWFETKTEADGFVRRPEWLMLFRAGTAEPIAEITNKERWEKRLLKDRPVRDLDFGMTLRAVHETLAHGRVLTAYERYALKLLHVWRHWLGDQGRMSG